MRTTNTGQGQVTGDQSQNDTTGIATAYVLKGYNWAKGARP